MTLMHPGGGWDLHYENIFYDNGYHISQAEFMFDSGRFKFQPNTDKIQQLL